MAFTSSQTNWTTSSLAAVHALINASGVGTDGKISFLAADTDNGLALMALIDRQLAAEGLFGAGNVHMDSIANGENLAFINSGATMAVGMNNADARVASGNFAWNRNGGGDGFAWAGLDTGDSMTFRFSRMDNVSLGLDDPATFQFLNWNGGAWEVMAVPSNLLSFSETDGYGFSAVAQAPTPGAAMLAAGGLGLVVLRRRRAAR
ncbi:MAG: hypothetical protein ACKVS8_03380 [Phycisphaerales bacterium]